MIDDPAEEEPEVYDPEDAFTDPTADGLTIPQVETDTGDVSTDLLVTFWLVVFGVNAGLMAIAVGLMLGGFRGNWTTAIGLVIAGALLLILAYRRYRTYVRDADLWSDEGTDTAAPDDGSDTATGTGFEPGVDISPPRAPDPGNFIERVRSDGKETDEESPSRRESDT